MKEFLRPLSSLKPYRWPLLGLGVAYLLTRLPCLTRLPVFLDEAIHIDWARQTLHGTVMAGLWAGRWLTVKLFALFALLPGDILWSSRLASVVAGLGTLALCVLVATRLWSWKEGVCVGILYLVTPYILLYDRLALTYGLLNALGMGVLLLSIEAVRKESILLDGVMAALISASILANLTGGVCLGVPWLAFLLLPGARRDRRTFLRLALISLSSVPILALSWWKGAGSLKQLHDQAGTEGPSITLQALSNSGLALDWLWGLLTPPLAFCVLWAISWMVVRIFKRQWGEEPFLFAVAVMTSLPFVILSRWWFPRYLLFSVLALLLLGSRTIVLAVSRGAQRIPKAFVLSGACILLLPWPVHKDLRILFSPDRASFPEADQVQYVTGWASGYGLRGLADFLTEEAEKEELNVVRLGIWGPASVGLDVYLPALDSLHMVSLNMDKPEAANTIQSLKTQARTLFLYDVEGDERFFGSLSAKLRESMGEASMIWSYQGPGGQVRFEVWESLR